jgi:hypothetical protein
MTDSTPVTPRTEALLWRRLNTLHEEHSTSGIEGCLGNPCVYYEDIMPALLARLPVPAPTPAGLDEERLGFYDLLDMADAILRHYPPDTIVCSHLHRADVGARTVAAIADLIESARLSRESDR